MLEGAERESEMGRPVRIQLTQTLLRILETFSEVSFQLLFSNFLLHSRVPPGSICDWKLKPRNATEKETLLIPVQPRTGSSRVLPRKTNKTSAPYFSPSQKQAGEEILTGEHVPMRFPPLNGSHKSNQASSGCQAQTRTC